MQATEQTIRTVIQEVLAQLGKTPYVPTSGANRQGAWGVFPTVDQAVADLNAGNLNLVLAEGSYVGEQVAGFNAVQAPVPEPQTAVLMVGGLAALLWRRRRHGPAA